MDINSLIKETNKYPKSYSIIKVLFNILINRKVFLKYIIDYDDVKKEIIINNNDNNKIEYKIELSVFYGVNDVFIEVIENGVIIHIDFIFNKTEIIKGIERIEINNNNINNKYVLYINKIITNIFG